MARIVYLPKCVPSDIARDSRNVPTADAVYSKGIYDGEIFYVDGTSDFFIYFKDENDKFVVKRLNDPVTQEDIKASITVGNIKVNNTLPAGTSLDNFIKALITKYITPVFNFSSNLGGMVEYGTNLSGPVVFSWNYNTGDSNNEDFSWGNVVDNSIYIDGWNGYNSGILAKGKKNTTKSFTSNLTNIKFSKADSGTSTKTISFTIHGQRYPNPENTDEKTNQNIATKSVSKTWSYKFFYGVTTVGNISNLTVSSMRSSASAFYPSTKSCTVTANNGDTIAWIAVPKGVTLTSVLALDSLNAEVKEVFIKYERSNFTTADGTEVPYDIWYYKPGDPFTQIARYKVTLS
jgi:hypothetical protein